MHYLVLVFFINVYNSIRELSTITMVGGGGVEILKQVETFHVPLSNAWKLVSSPHCAIAP